MNNNEMQNYALANEQPAALGLIVGFWCQLMYIEIEL